MTSLINLAGKKGLILGVANDKSIAYGCAKEISASGAELVLTYQNEKTKSFVEPLTKDLSVSALLPCDVTKEGELEAVFAWIEKHWGQLDFIVHSIAFAKKDDLQNPVIDASSSGFSFAMDISCHSFIRMAKLAAPLMTGPDGGVMLTMTYYGSIRAVENYSIMGPVKAALESTARYLAFDLAPKKIRVFCISPGPIATRAASGIKEFDELTAKSQELSPMKRLVTIDEVGNLAAFLVSSGSSGMTGQVIFADTGMHLVGE